MKKLKIGERELTYVPDQPGVLLILLTVLVLLLLAPRTDGCSLNAAAPVAQSEAPAAHH